MLSHSPCLELNTEIVVLKPMTSSQDPTVGVSYQGVVLVNVTRLKRALKSCLKKVIGLNQDLFVFRKGVGRGIPKQIFSCT